MRILAIDTCLQSCNVALVDGDGVITHERLEMARGHAETLAPLVDKVLSNAGLVIADLDRVGVTIGPGSFAGVRVGLAFARGLAIGHDLPVLGVTTLQALAGQLRESDMNAVAIDARRGQVYGQLFRGHTPVGAPLIDTPEIVAAQMAAQGAGLDTYCWAGSGAALVYTSANPVATQLDAVVIARLTALADPANAKPEAMYLRPPDAAPAKAPF